MAIQQHQRENLVSEATAYRRRALICPQGLNFRGIEIRELFIGQRQSGGWSLYLDETPVLQFNARRALRRLHLQGQLYVAESGRLILLVRGSQGGRIQVSRLPMEESQERLLLAELSALVSSIVNLLSNNFDSNWLQNRCPQEDSKIVADCANWLNRSHEILVVAESPSAMA